MANIIYQTEGIILSGSDFGEADRIFTVFTEKFGKITAAAKSVRQMKSKLRCNLETFSLSRFGLLAGKSSGRPVWKIIDAEEIARKGKITSSPRNLALFSGFAGLLNRMVQGEEKNDFLWSELKNAYAILSEKTLGKEEAEELEISFLSGTLHNLGYMEKEKYASRRAAISAINNAIKESML
ncbi:MAG: DNA repair protein RecO [bacterium]|nr:DNA repair protein RecO [bacterium]